MQADIKNFSIQLERTTKLAGARWAIWLGMEDRDWKILIRTGVNKTRRSEIERLLESVKFKAWIAGAMSSGRVRTRQASDPTTSLGCDRLYCFPNNGAQSLIVVGCDQLSKESQEFFKILSLHDLLQDYPPMEFEVDEILVSPVGLGLGATYQPGKVLIWILEVMSNSLPADAAFLAVRKGEAFRIDAQWNYDAAILGKPISIYASRELRIILATLNGVISKGPNSFPEFVESEKLAFPVSSFLTIPILVRQRLIGIMVFASARFPGLNRKNLDKAIWMAERMAHAVESAILFEDISRYLQQSTLLTELALAATAESDPDQIARRLIRRLERTFRTNQVVVLLVSPDGKYLRTFGSPKEDKPLTVPVSESLLGYVVETGLPYCTGDVRQAPRFYFKKDDQAQSFLAAPLKYRGKISGVIGIESAESEAFNTQDEQLLVVIASQLAGIIENVRLMQEAKERAQNLNLIHQVLGRVVGLVDTYEIAALTATLVAQYFHYALVCVLVPDQSSQNLAVIGAGGDQAASLEIGMQFSIDHGICGRVFRTGKSSYVNEAIADPDYYSTGLWTACSELVVPLISGDQILGVIDCQSSEKDSFDENDVLLFESLAGILTSVLSHAHRHEERQLTITQLDLVRETALDISNLELDDLIERVIRNARLLVDAPGAELGLVEMEHNCVRVISSENPWYKLAEGIRPMGVGVTGRIAQSGKPLSVPDYNTWSGRIFPDRPHPCTAVAGVPLMIKGAVIGTLVVMDDKPGRHFTEADLHLLELLAPQVGVSIRNARLYQELQERIKAQTQAERQLLQSARMAAVGEMAAGVAHELNNPLTTVTGFVELALEELPLDLPQRDELKLVLAEAHRARKVVRRLLDFSRRSEHQRQSIHPGSLLDDLLPLIQHQLHDADIRIHIDCQEGMYPILVDADQIKQVLLNLVQNAIQAMPNGGDLKIAAMPMVYQGRSGAVFSIDDTGEGILPENLDRVFEPFFTTRPVGSGTGLGLSVSYGIVADHNGQILVESQVGAGSTFQVWLPGDHPQHLTDPGETAVGE